MHPDMTPARAVSIARREAPDVDVLDVAVGLEMRGLVDETTQERFGRDVFEIARQRLEEGLPLDQDPPRWSVPEYHGWRGWAERWLPVLHRFNRGFLFGAGTLFVFMLLWFSDLSQRITPAGGIVVAATVYLASAGWSRLMSVSAGAVVHYSRFEADRQLLRYALRAVATLSVLMALVAAGYAAVGTLTDTLGPGSVVMASIANLTLFWLTLAFAASQRRPWLILLSAIGGLAGYFIARTIGDLSPGMDTQVALATFNLVGILCMIGRALPAYRRQPAFPPLAAAGTLPRRRRRFLAALGIGYGFLILSDFVVLAGVGYFNGTRLGTEVYLVLKLVAIIPLVVSLGFMEVLQHRLGETISGHEERLASSDARFTPAIRRAFYLSVLSIGSLHMLGALVAGTLLLPGMPLRHVVAESALTADIIVPGLLGALGITFALAGMFCATLLSTMGDDEAILKWLLTGLALSLAVGGTLYPWLGIAGAALGFAAGTGAFLAFGARAVAARMGGYSLLSYRQAIG
jgi:hypothetical protein